MTPPDLGGNAWQVYVNGGAWLRYLDECVTAIDDWLSVEIDGVQRERGQMQRALLLKMKKGGHVLTAADCRLLGWEYP